MHHSGDEWVIVHVSVDMTGFPVVAIVDRIFRGSGSESECRRFAERLNNTSRKDNMDVFLARRVGDDSEDDVL